MKKADTTQIVAGIALLMAMATFALAEVVAPPASAVVRIPSHGGSGTAIATGDGWTIILSCAHMFEGQARNKPIVVEMATPIKPGGDKKVGSRVLAVGRTDVNDVSVIQVNVGPVHYVSPVAPIGYRPDGDCWSAGFDELKFPAHCRPAKIVRSEQNTYFTDARPWHGRSGGALIEKRSGYVIGVVSAYTGPRNHSEYHPGANGVYADLAAVHQILVTAGVMKRTDGQPRQQQFQSPSPFDCPDGTCPVPGRGAGNQFQFQRRN